MDFSPVSHRPGKRPLRVGAEVSVEDAGDVAHEDPPQRGQLDLAAAHGDEAFALELPQPGQLALPAEGAAEVDPEVAHDAVDHVAPGAVVVGALEAALG